MGRRKAGKLRKLTLADREKKLARDVRRDREGAIRRKNKKMPGGRDGT